MEPNFMDSTAKIMAEIRAIAGIEGVDTKAIEEILKEGLDEYYDELNAYYDEEYYIALSSARGKAYDDGHSDGYAEGYAEGYKAVQSSAKQ